MKNKVLISVLILFLLGGGWYSSLSDISEKEAKFEYYYGLAVKKAGNGLYVEALENYNSALEYKPTGTIVKELVKTASDYYALETNTSSLNSYVKALTTAIELDSENPEYWETLMEVYIDQGDYSEALDIGEAASQNGLMNEKMQELVHTAKYQYDVGTTYKSAFLEACNGYFMTAVGDKWKWCRADGTKESGNVYAKVGYIGDRGIFLCEDLEGNIYFTDTSAVKRGVVKENPTYFGLYSQGYCNVAYEDNYALIDLYGEELIGNLAYCGSFQNGCAVIQFKEGNWGLVNTSGNTKAADVDEVKCDAMGRYSFGEAAIVQKAGKYYFYNYLLDEAINAFSCADIDILTSDGIVAFQGDNGLWGFVDLEGNIVIEPQYELAKSFANGVAAVCAGGKWGYINKQNEIVVDCIYLDCGYLSDGGAALVSDERDNYVFLKFKFPDLL